MRPEAFPPGHACLKQRFTDFHPSGLHRLAAVFGEAGYQHAHLI